MQTNLPPSVSNAPVAAPTGIPVPLSFLASPDSDEQMQTPEVGDSGTMQVDYKVVSIDGDNAIIQPVTINGNEVEGAAEDSQETADTEMQQEGTDLRSMAATM